MRNEKKEKEMKEPIEKLFSFYRDKKVETTKLVGPAFDSVTQIDLVAIPSVPVLKLPSYVPKSGAKTSSTSVKPDFLEMIDGSLKNFQQNAGLAQKDRIDAFSHYPGEKMRELTDVYSQFVMMREMVGTKLKGIEALLKSKQKALGQKFAPLSTKFQDYKAKFNTARQTDNIGENHLQAARSSVQEMTDLKDQLEVIEGDISCIIQDVQSLRSEYSSQLQLSPQELMRQKSEVQSKLTLLSVQLQDKCDANRTAANSIRNLSKRQLDSFVQSSTMALQCFRQGGQFYSTVDQALSVFETNI